MRVYIVQMKGVYRHKVKGVFESEPAAKAAVEFAFKNQEPRGEYDTMHDFDGHHDFIIIECALNTWVDDAGVLTTVQIGTADE